MIYTIGHTENYERYFKEQGTPQKLGKTDDYFSEEYPDGKYPGGSVWKTREEAQKGCHPDYSVYGVDADWDTQTYNNPGESFHSLLVTANLIKL